MDLGEEISCLYDRGIMIDVANSLYNKTSILLWSLIFGENVNRSLKNTLTLALRQS